VVKTDKVIQREVMDELSWDPSLHAENIGVQVAKGIVTLSGKINTYWEKSCAETSTQRVVGVKGVVMDLSTDASTFNTRTDVDIASAARNALGYILPISSDDVKVEVHKGAVTLSGTVEWRFQMVETQAVISRLSGVTNVISHLTVRPRADKKVVKRDIENALARQAQVESDGVTVTVSGSEVTLTGDVHSWAERLAVANAAWCAPGVTQVKDALHIR
jgi:osmotically-inducible protein OsmY